MNIHVLSDLHLEFWQFTPPPTDADVVILAGDTDLGDKGIAWARQHFSRVPVMYLLGNHEYYRHAYPTLVQTLKEKTRGSNIHVLENDVITIGEVVFLGCTLWTDFALFGDAQLAGINAMQTMSDYRLIRISPSYSKLRSLDTVTIHQQSRAWLEQQLQIHSGQKMVVVTHHAPSAQSIPEQYKADLLSAAFASRLDELVANSRAKVWIHGHTHEAKAYWIGETRVVCNPRGYPNETSGFDAGLVLEV